MNAASARADLPALPAQIQLALISHTNAGKTTLARTLLGFDVGEVRDAPHVTTAPELHTLLATPTGDVLQLWDTPGFGDSVRLVKRLRMADNPIGWFLREVVDRYRDRTFWLSQQAVRAARDAADVVLYLVNSSEDPQDAGYVLPEMKILQWLGKPVVILLNQTGTPRPFAQEQAEQARWHSHFADFPVVKVVLALDAFARCWVHERVFYQALAPLVPTDKGDAYARLVQVWEQGNAARLQASMRVIARQIALAAHDSEALEPTGSAVLHTLLGAVGLGQQRAQKRQDKAWHALLKRQNDGVLKATAELLRLHHLDAGEAAKINDQVQQGFVVRAPIDTRQAGLLGAAISGAATGLSADLLAGGMTFGAGALVGGLLGALTFSGAAWAFNTSTDRDHSSLHFSPDFLRTQLVAALLRYLAVTHFGRGRGKFVEMAAPGFWQQEVEVAMLDHQGVLTEAFRRPDAQDHWEESATALAAALTQMTMQVFARLYPNAVPT
jgi:GTPase SAR1 family protein